jgi:hypothetical protein
MPLEGTRLLKAEIELLSKWIEQGAISPADEFPLADEQHHWAFQLPQRPQIPVHATSTSTNDVGFDQIDAFLNERRQSAGTQSLPPTDRATLLRRLDVDLMGVPPTAQELRLFVQDDSVNACEKIVDQLLESPQHGERWARYWMDVWRYSDWYRRRPVPDVMNSYPMIWRWRDLQLSSIHLPITIAYPRTKEFIRVEEREKCSLATNESEKQITNARNAISASPDELHAELRSA